jgi:hypothetical protein
MPPVKKKDDKEITVEAELEVSWPGGSKVLRRYDRAWVLGLEMATEHGLPVLVHFVQFVRKDV